MDEVRVWLRPTDRPGRRTRWSTVLVEPGQGGEPVSLDTTLPNRLVGRALESSYPKKFAGSEVEAREWSHGGSRFDAERRPRSRLRHGTGPGHRRGVHLLGRRC